MEKTIETISQIPDEERYSETDIAFLDSIFQKRAKGQMCPNCKSTVIRTYKRRKGTTKYQCKCLYPVFPLAGTPMEATHARLSLWMEVLKLRMTKGKINPKELLIDHGGSYKTYRGMLLKIENWLTVSQYHESSKAPDAVIDKMLRCLPPLFTNHNQRKIATIKILKNDLPRNIR